MNKVTFNVENDGLYACYYPAKNSELAFICLTGYDTKDLFARTIAKWLNKQNISAFCMSQNKKDYSYHSFPLERFEKAITYLKNIGIKKIGVIGMSTTSTISLIASSYFSDITLTIVISPNDFVMEGFYIENGVVRLGNNESLVCYKGKELPCLKFAYKDSKYNSKLKEESKLTHNKIASKKLFDDSEKLCPLNEENRIKVENIKGTILFIGAKDDALWNTCKYINRMREVLLNSMKKGANARFLIYKHGTHFLLPESLLKMFHLPTSFFPSFYFKSGKLYKKECKASRIDVDKNIKDAIKVWKEINIVPDCHKNHLKCDLN